MRCPSERIVGLVVLNNAGNRTLAVQMRLHAFGYPARRGNTISREEGHKRCMGYLDTHVSRRANIGRLGKLNKNDVLKIFAQYVSYFATPGIYDNDLRRSILLNDRANSVKQRFRCGQANDDDEQSAIPVDCLTS